MHPITGKWQDIIGSIEGGLKTQVEKTRKNTTFLIDVLVKTTLAYWWEEYEEEGYE